MTSDPNEFPCFARGWVKSNENPGATLVRLSDGGLLYANKQPHLVFGTPVTATLFRRRRGGYEGEIFEAEMLPEISPRKDDRPYAIIDEANVAGFGEPCDVSCWTKGAVKVYAASWGLDCAGYHPVVLADPCNRRAYTKHAPSSRALQAINANQRWIRRAVDYGRASQNADLAVFSIAEQFPTAIVVTATDRYREPVIRKRFPWLDTPEGRGRVFRVQFDMSKTRVEIPPLAVSEELPVALFARR